MVDSSLWVMQDLDHHPYPHAKGLGLKSRNSWVLGSGFRVEGRV